MRKLILVIVILSLFACAEFSNDHSSGEVLKRQKRKILLYPDNTVLQVNFISWLDFSISAINDRISIFSLQCA